MSTPAAHGNTVADIQEPCLRFDSSRTYRFTWNTIAVLQRPIASGYTVPVLNVRCHGILRNKYCCEEPTTSKDNGQTNASTTCTFEAGDERKGCQNAAYRLPLTMIGQTRPSLEDTVYCSVDASTLHHFRPGWHRWDRDALRIGCQKGVVTTSHFTPVTAACSVNHLLSLYLIRHCGCPSLTSLDLLNQVFFE